MSNNVLYDELKAAQTTAMLLKLNGGKENLLKLVKLLYAIERESLKRWGCPFTYDKLVSMPHGQVVSNTYNHIRETQTTGVWGGCFKTTKRGGEKTVHLLGDCGIGKLSRADILLIAEIYEANKGKSPQDLEHEHHDPKITPEYIETRSSIKTDYSRLLAVLGKTSTEIDSFSDELKEVAFINSLKC